MNSIPEALFKKLCFIFHRGFVEARLLALQDKAQQAQDLADAFEIMPGYLPEWNNESLDRIRAHLHEYQDKYGRLSFDYLSILDMDNQEFADIHSKW